MGARFTKIGTDGAELPEDATQWVAVRDSTSDLIWSVEEVKKPLTWKKSIEWAKKLTVAGFTDWRLPTVEELFLLADRTRHSPAIDTTFFPGCTSDWYWTSTPAAYSPGDVAWLVRFSYGDSDWSYLSYDHRVRAVRSTGDKP